MGYRDDLYQAANIYGYTGDLRNFPTVYFREVIVVPGQPNTIRFGHITWMHDVISNIGRETVYEDPNYVIENVMRDGEVKCIERIGNMEFHESRSMFKRPVLAHQQHLTPALIARRWQKAHNSAVPPLFTALTDPV